MSSETETPSRIKSSWLAGILAAFAVFAVVGWYSGHMTRAYVGYDQQRATDRYATLQKVESDENAIINAPAGWVDQNKKTIHIPIEEAMAREVETLQSQPPRQGAALPVVAPAPAPVPAKTETSTNAAPAAPAKPNK